MNARRGSEGLRRGISFSLVVAAHLVIFVGALHWRARESRHESEAAMEAMMVDVSLTSTAPATPASDVPPGERVDEQSHRELELEPPQLEIEIPPEVVAPGDLAAAVPRETVASNAPGANRATAPPSVNATSDTHYSAAQTTAGASARAAANWQSVLLGHLERFKRYPLRAKRFGEEGVAYVRFSLDRQGKVHDARLESSSGYAALDEETLAVVERANPVPPPPPEMPGDTVEVLVPVTFYLKRRT